MQLNLIRQPSNGEQPKFTVHFERNQSLVQQKAQIIKNETHHATMKQGTSMIMAQSSRKNRLLASKFTLHFESNQSLVQHKKRRIKNETHHAMKLGTSMIMA